MDEREYAGKLLEDKAFLQKACMSIPEDLLRKLDAENKAAAAANKRGEQTGSADQIGEQLTEYFTAAAQAMGHTMDPATLATEIDRQLKEKGMFAMVKFTLRFGKATGKANKQYGIK